MTLSTRRPPADGGVNMFDLAEQARFDTISMGLGDPDFATPAPIIAAAHRAIDEGRTGPTPRRGLLELRQAIARKLDRDNGITADPASEILVTTGGQEALFLLIQAIIEPGDEVIVPDPRYTSYDAAIDLAGGTRVLVPTTEAYAFDLDPKEVEQRITPKSKVLILISPNNPTGGIVTPANIRGLAEIAIRHDLIVISDEIYEQFVYDDAQVLSIASLPGMRERTITLNGVSKTYAMTGWRIGYLAGPPELIRVVSALKAMVNVQAPTVSQWAAVAALDGPQGCVAEMRAAYAARRAKLLAFFDEMDFSYGMPRGGLYIWVNIGTTGLPATELARRFMHEGVLVVPGSAFGAGWDDYLRMTILQPIEVLDEAILRMRRALRAPG